MQKINLIIAYIDAKIRLLGVCLQTRLKGKLLHKQHPVHARVCL